MGSFWKLVHSLRFLLIFHLIALESYFIEGVRLCDKSDHMVVF